MDGEEELGPQSQALLAALRAHGACYGRGAKLPLVGTTEQCEREIEVEEEAEVQHDAHAARPGIAAAVQESDWRNWQAAVELATAADAAKQGVPVRTSLPEHVKHGPIPSTPCRYAHR